MNNIDFQISVSGSVRHNSYLSIEITLEVCLVLGICRSLYFRCSEDVGANFLSIHTWHWIETVDRGNWMDISTTACADIFIDIPTAFKVFIAHWKINSAIRGSTITGISLLVESRATLSCCCIVHICLTCAIVISWNNTVHALVIKRSLLSLGF